MERGVFYLKEIIDVFIVYYLVYKLILILKGTKAVQILWGFFLLAILTFLAKFLGFRATFWLLGNFWFAGIFILIIVFQPEIRNTLANLGTSPFSKVLLPSEYSFISHLIEAIKVASEKKMGMLVVLEQNMGLGDYIKTGIIINGEVSKELLLTIFYKDTPLHDGAVIISGNRLIAAACQLPLSENINISKILGMRHRSAVGITEESDAIAIVVSEETGNISVARNGNLMVRVEPDIIEKELINIYSSKYQKTVFRRTEKV